MQPSQRITTHPGQVLLHEFLEPLGQTQRALANHLNIPTQRINEIIRGKRSVSAESAWLLAQALGTSPEFWLQLQAKHDLSKHKPDYSVGKFPAKR